MLEPDLNRKLWDKEWDAEKQREKDDEEPPGQRAIRALVAMAIFAALYGTGWLIFKHGELVVGAGFVFFDWLFSPPVIVSILVAAFLIWFVSVQSRIARSAERTAAELSKIKALLERNYDKEN